MTQPLSTPRSRVPAVWLVLGGIVSVQFGAAIAKGLFDEVHPTALVWLRLATSAVVLLLLARPRLTGRSRRDWSTVVGFGLSLGVMNWAIYQSFSRIPLGIAVTLEFIGPLTVAVAGSRRARDLVWVLLAGAGVVLLGAEPGRLTMAGVLFALVAGAAWGAYILLSAGTGRRWPGLEGLAVASVIATLLLAPAAVARSDGDFADPRILGLGAAIGMLSSVIPYSFEITALRRIRPAVFGILMSLEPAVAALAAMLVLQEFLTVTQWVAVGCVVAASVGATRSSPPSRAEPLPD
ncbi:MAG TPA: EamA family transporter [Marmoricola sp.]|nr:EamA family transporter [Marmoricola sp.]